jgi:hypothetical protein
MGYRYDANHAMSEYKHYLTTAPHPRKPDELLAIISHGSPQLGDKEVLVCTLTSVKTQEEAEKWFKEQLVTKPWETRQ